MNTNGFYTMKNGLKIPAIGFGTWQIINGNATYDAVSYALKYGYRHIDTAYVYGNEQSVGKAISDSGIKRNEIFVTSKLSAEMKDYKKVWQNFEKTIENLGFEYLDLYLIHAPWPWSDRGGNYSKENKDIWTVMEEIYESGRCKAIGVSNFIVSDLEAVMNIGKIKPMVNQIRYYIGNTQSEVVKFCKDNNILVEGYSPFATGRILNNSDIKKIAEKYNVSVPQLCIKYVLQNEILPLPKSVHPEYILKNTEVDFEIIEEDMHKLNRLKDTFIK